MSVLAPERGPPDSGWGCGGRLPRRDAPELGPWYEEGLGVQDRRKSLCQGADKWVQVHRCEG